MSSQLGVKRRFIDGRNDWRFQTEKAPVNTSGSQFIQGEKLFNDPITFYNDVICHGIPGDKVLKNGDVVNLDITVITPDGYYGDTSRMFYIGEPSIKAKRLTQITYEAMMLGIEQVKPGAHLGDIGNAIQTHAVCFGRWMGNDHGFSGRKFCDALKE